MRTEGTNQVVVGHGHPRYRPSTSAPGRTTQRRLQRGVVFVELALVMAPLVMIVFSVIDFAHMAKFQNRLTNAAREGAAIAQYYPGWVGPSALCPSANAGRNVTDRATREDPELPSFTGFQVRVHKVGSSTYFTPGCSTVQPAGVVPGDQLEVEVEARFATTAPFTRFLWGNDVLIKRTAVFVMQGKAP